MPVSGSPTSVRAAKVYARVAMKEMTLGDLHLASTGRTVSLSDGQSATKTAGLRGTAELFSVHSPAWEMTIAHNRWDNGDRDIRLHDPGPLRSDLIVSEAPAASASSPSGPTNVMSSSCRPR